MSAGQIVLLAFAAVMLLGGVMGYRAGSSASLYAGSASGVLLLVAWFVSRSRLAVGLWIGAVISLLLCVSFAMRLAKTGKFMPAGALLIVSAASLLFLCYSAFQSGEG